MLCVLVTGGCGFIGSNFIRHILQSRPQCTGVNLDKLTYAGNLDNLRDIEQQWGQVRYFFVKGDIADREAVQGIFESKLFSRPSVVVHFAAESHVDRSIVDVSPFVDTNIKGTQVLLDAAREYGVRRFCHVSTDEVYGSLSLTGAERFCETFPLRPNSPYSASKASSDLICLAYHKTYATDLIITRCCNNYGPYQFPEKLIPLMTLNAMEGKSLPIYGDGLYVREWIHVRDHSSAIDFLIDQGQPGEIYNIGTGQEIANIDTVRTILQCVAKMRGRSASEMENLLTYVKDRPGHDRRYAINSEKLNRLGWKPQIDWEKGIAETVNWYGTNGEWCEKVRSGEYKTFYQTWYSQRVMEHDTGNGVKVAEKIY